MLFFSCIGGSSVPSTTAEKSKRKKKSEHVVAAVSDLGSYEDEGEEEDEESSASQGDDENDTDYKVSGEGGGGSSPELIAAATNALAPLSETDTELDGAGEIVEDEQQGDVFEAVKATSAQGERAPASAANKPATKCKRSSQEQPAAKKASA